MVGMILWLGFAPERMGGPVHQGAAQSGQMIYLPIIYRPPNPPGRYRTVNALPIASMQYIPQAAVFWFGRVTADENYADVRVGYTPSSLILRLSAFDRRIWYNARTDTSVFNTLTEWDGASFFFNTRGQSPTQPLADSYRIIVQWSVRNQPYHTRVLKGNGSGWVDVSLPFTLRNGWRGNQPNDDSGDDAGWLVEMEIPFAGFGGAPAVGATWGMQVEMYDRDSAAGPALPVKRWPAGANEIGQLRFGLPGYAAPAHTAPQQVILRHGQNGVSVQDAQVGGSSTCGAGLNRWTQWGNKNWYPMEFFNVQNQDDMADFPCFSKEYLAFPLNNIPPGKVIVSARLVIYLFGNAGQGTGAAIEPSYLQMSRVAEAWDPTTITWNNAPPLWENFALSRVDPVNTTPRNPGVRYEFDASRAVAQAYAEGQPLRVVLYSADWAMHSGKYFYSSYKTYNANGLPALEITYGNP